MPVTYQIDKARQLIRTRCVGPVTIEEVLGHFRELERDPECPGHLDVLLDLSEETSLPKPQNLREITSAIRGIRETVRFGKCAIVAPSDGLFGLLRMFEVFAEQYFHESYVFRTTEEAEKWLTAKHPTTLTAH
jgi:hypothetical protein